MRKQNLHWLIALEVGISLFSVTAGWFGVDRIGLDPQLQEWIITEEERYLTKRELITALVALAFFPILVFSWVWLWKLKPYSRGLYSAVVFSGFIFYPLESPYVSNGWFDILDAFASIITGMILCSLYFTDIYPRKQKSEQT